MRVEKTLQLTAIASVLVGLIIALMLSLALFQVNNVREESDIAGEIVNEAFERSLFGEDFLRTGNERAKVQWFAKHEQLARLLKSATGKFKHQEDKQTINEMIENLEATGKLFSAIVDNREKAVAGATPAPLSQEIESRLATQLGMRFYSNVLSARKLHDAADRHLLSTLSLAGGGILCIVVVATAAALLNSWTMSRTITNRIGLLRSGALIIGGGNLKYRTDIKGDDEFAELAGVFDAMTAKLGETHLELENQVAERKNAEEELRKLSHLNQLILEYAGEGIFGLDREGNMMFVNSVAAQMLGYQREELMGNTSHGTWHAKKHDGSPYPYEMCPIHSVYEKGGTNSGEEFFWRKDGTGFFADYTSRPIYEGGKITGSVVIYRDVTERKKYEQELLKARNDAEAANQAKSQFLANMSHELRTPLNGILGVLQLLLTGHAGPLAGKQKELLVKANKSTDSLLQIISDILDLSKIEAGKLRFDEKAFSLRKCLSDAVDYFTMEAQQKGLDLTLSFAEDVPDAVRGDQVRLRQVLLNLIGNGVKFTEQGKVGVQVAAGSEVVGGRREISFLVTDTGIGVPPDKKHLLFRSFSQVDASDTRRYGGTGLGLVISSQIVEMMGGTITYQNREEGGSSFAFTVFLEEAAEATVADNEAEIPQSLATALPASKTKATPHILAAEDDALAGELLKQILEVYGLEMDLARTGQEAIEMWEKGSYDLIIMDVQMPRMDGITATRNIREKEKSTGSHIPIIAMTAHAYREDEERCIAAGMDGYLTKPLDLEKGREVIMAFLNK